MMKSFEWREEYSVKHPPLDAQHRKLLELISELVTSGQSGNNHSEVVRATLKKLDRYADWHLRCEELVLRVRGYPGYAEHKAEHDAYRKKVSELKGQQERKDIGLRVQNYLAEWWRYHILTSDREYARFFNPQLRESGSRLVGSELARGDLTG